MCYNVLGSDNLKNKKKDKNKIYRIITNIINWTMMICTFIIVIYFLKIKDYTRLSTDVMIYIAIFVPKIFEKTKYKLNDKYKLIYSIFILLGDFLGSVINLYDHVWWFDLFVHFLSGMLTVVVANYILERSKYKELSGLIKFIYVLGFSSLIAVCWESIEFFIDIVFKMNMQHSQDTGVIDTMTDMIIATLGSLTMYLINLKTDKHQK